MKQVANSADPEDGGDIQRTTRCYILQYMTFHNHRCENLKSYKKNQIRRKCATIGFQMIYPSTC
jgi:hypothetical protein